MLEQAAAEGVMDRLRRRMHPQRRPVDGHRLGCQVAHLGPLHLALECPLQATHEVVDVELRRRDEQALVEAFPGVLGDDRRHWSTLICSWSR
jgi:hypothetical protein